MMPMPREAAERLALGALTWIAADAERAAGFLGASGAAPGDLRARAGEPDFLGFVLDFVLQEDAQVLALAEALGCRPEEIARARGSLPGGDLPNWT